MGAAGCLGLWVISECRFPVCIRYRMPGSELKTKTGCNLIAKRNWKTCFSVGGMASLRLYALKGYYMKAHGG
jgi:hypothetical protein